MRVSKIQRHQTNEDTIYRVSVESERGAYSLWFSVENEYDDYVCKDKHDAFLLALLPIAMKNGEDIYVEGSVSEKLFYDLSRFAVTVLSGARRDLRPISIHPEDLAGLDTQNTATAVGAAFSGGVDSFCTFLDNFKGDVPHNYKITHLFISNTGAVGQGSLEKSLNDFKLEKEFVKKIAGDIPIKFVSVNSNIAEISPFKHINVHTSMNFSAVLLLQNLFKKFYYSSGVSFRDVHLRPAQESTYSEAVMIPFYCTETLEFIGYGGQFKRSEKTSRIAESKLAQKYLYVCFDHLRHAGHNCSRCEKCRRTMATLDALGKLEDFSDRFDISRFKNDRERYLFNLMRNRGEPSNRDILDLMAQRHYQLPLYVRTAAELSRIVVPPAMLSWLKDRLPDQAKTHIKNNLTRTSRRPVGEPPNPTGNPS